MTTREQQEYNLGLKNQDDQRLIELSYHGSTPKANTSIGEAEFVRTRVEAKAKCVSSPDKEVRLSASNMIKEDE